MSSISASLPMWAIDGLRGGISFLLLPAGARDRTKYETSNVHQLPFKLSFRSTAMTATECIRLRRFAHCCLVVLPLLYSSVAGASLIGSELEVQIVIQSTAGSAAQQCTSLNPVTVVDPGVEFPALGSTSFDCAGFFPANVAIDASGDAIEIDFDNAGSGVFGATFFNGYRFTFDDAGALAFSGALIDTAATTLGLTADDVSFLGNQLLVNVSGLAFNPNSHVRIGVTTVPTPASGILLATGWLILFARRLKAARGSCSAAVAGL